MTRYPQCVLILAFAFACFAGTASADESDRSLDVGGLLFGDLYYVPSFHNEEGDGATGVVVRRGYLTFDADLGTNWFGRLRFEANQSGEFEKYDFEVDYKDVYLGRNFGEHRLVLGLSPTLTFDLIESWWGLRYLARTPMDLQGVASRDTGIALRGPLAADGIFGYRLMFSSGEDFGTDITDGSKMMGAISWQPNPSWIVDLYADYESHDDAPDRQILQGFVGFKSESLRWGLQYSRQDREQDPPLELVSGFLVARAGERSDIVLRVDRLLEPSPKGDDISYLPFDPSAKATMLIAGLEFRHGSHYRVTPNVVIKRYDQNDAGEQPETDVQLRLTLFVDFE